MEASTVQIRQRGVITLPAKLRRRHSLETGDTLTLIDLDGAFFVAPSRSMRVRWRQRRIRCIRIC